MSEELKVFVLKIATFIFGLLIGLAAKLATLNQKEKLTVSMIIYQSCVAFAAAWAIWHLLVYLGRPELATGASVVVGRFADNILLLMWNWVKKLFKHANDDIQKL